MRRNKKGVVLLQVMILGIIIALLAAGMASMLLMRKYAASRLEENNIGLRADNGGLSQLLYSWNLKNNGNGGVCSSLAGVYTCSPSAPSCKCKCTPTYSASGPVISVISLNNNASSWPGCGGYSKMTVNY